MENRYDIHCYFLVDLCRVGPCGDSGIEKPGQISERLRGQDETDHQDYYTIELYDINGFIRKKHTAKISYEDLMEIKDKLDSFKGSTTDEMEYCLELLTEKGVLSDVQWKMKLLSNNQIVKSMDDKNDCIKVESNPDILVFNSHFIGNFQFVVSSPSHVLFAAPILAMIAGPSSIEYGSSYMEYSSLGLLLFSVMGLILIIPIFSSVGYINAEVVFAFGYGYK